MSVAREWQLMNLTEHPTNQWRRALEAEYGSRLRAWSDIQGHLEFLHDLAVGIVEVRVVELGTRTGVSTAAFLHAAEAADGHVWSVDLEQPAVPSWWPLTGRWTLTVGDDLEPQVIGAQPDPDVLLIDTSHTYEQTLAELRAWVPRVRVGGWVCCHDTDLSGHDERGMGIEGADGAVRRALDDYCAETGLTWSNRPGSYGMGVIKIKE
jgi:Methyltransferase domain